MRSVLVLVVSSTQGQGGRSARPPHGPILGTVEGVFSGQWQYCANKNVFSADM